MNEQQEREAFFKHVTDNFEGKADYTKELADQVISYNRQSWRAWQARAMLGDLPPDINKALAIIEGDLARLKNASFAAIESVALLRQAFATPQGIPALLERERCAIVAESGFRFAKDGYEIADEIRLGPNETNWSTL